MDFLNGSWATIFLLLTCYTNKNTYNKNLCYDIFSWSVFLNPFYTILDHGVRMCFKRSHFVYIFLYFTLGVCYGFDKGSSWWSIKRRTHRRIVIKFFRYYGSAQCSANSRFQDFVKKYNKINSELLILKNCNSLLLKRVTNLKRNALNNAQYIRRETIEINPIPQLTPLLTKRIKYVERILRIFKPVIV